MNSKQRYIEKKEEILTILDDKSLDASKKLDKLNFLETLTTLEIYQTELSAQNQELLDKEQQLIDSKDEFEELYNFAPIAYLKLDDNFKILKYNKTAFNMLAKNKQSIKIRDQLQYYIYKKGMIKYIDFISKAKELGKNEGVLQFLDANDIFYGRVNINSYEKDHETYYLLSIIDVTSEIKQEAIILNQAKNAAMGEMLSLITHQWKQPLSILSTVSTGMEALLDIDNFDKERFMDFLRNIGDQVEYMNDTIEDFKSFFSEQKNKEKINIQECINKSIKFTTPALKKYDIQLDISFKNKEDYIILAYNNDVCQILMNVINNAKDQLKKKEMSRKIWIHIYSEENSVVFAIKNNGGIIPSEIKDNIFNKHFTTKSSEDGTGLGLYISKKIVDEHLEGHFSVENILIEDSVVFYLKIPLVEKKA